MYNFIFTVYFISSEDPYVYKVKLLVTIVYFW